MNLTDKELAIIKDTDFLLTKVKATENIGNLLVQTRKNLKNIISENDFSFPSDINTKTGKVSKGENYLYLPYMVLDFPALFSKEDIFTFRTMFWWGHFFSFTLHLQGSSLELYRSHLIQNFEQLISNNIYVCVGKTPWHYHYEEDNYELFSSNHLNLLKENPFVKLSYKIPLSQWKTVPEQSVKYLKLYLDVLQSQKEGEL